MRTLLLALLVFPVALGCGALFNGGPAKVTFTSAPEQAEVWIDGTRRGTTPVILDLAKNQDYTVMFKKPGHGDQVVALTKKVSGGYVVLDVLGGLIPVVIDAATGSWYVLSTNAVHGTLSPSTETSGTLTAVQLMNLRNGMSLDRVLAGVPR